MSNRILSKTLTAQGVIPKYTIAKAGSADGTCALATAATEALIGITPDVGANDGGRVDVTLLGIELCTAGGSFVAGDPLTANADGYAIKAVPGVGAVVEVVGYARESGEAGQIVPVLLQRGQMRGAAA